MRLKLNNKGASMYEIMAVTFIITFFFINVISIFMHMTISTRINHDKTFAINDANHTYVYLSKVSYLHINIDFKGISNDSTPYVVISNDKNHKDPARVCSLPHEKLCRKAFKLDDDSAYKREVYFYSYSNQDNIDKLAYSLDDSSQFKSYLEDLVITDGVDNRNQIRMSIVLYYDDTHHIVNHYLWEVTE